MKVPILVVIEVVHPKRQGAVFVDLIDLNSPSLFPYQKGRLPPPSFSIG